MPTASAPCALRSPEASIWDTGNDQIQFHLPGTAPVTIQIGSRLPYITSRNGTVTIDGYSQPGSSVNTAEFGSNAVPGVEIRGNGGSAKEAGLVITSPGNTVRGLVMDNLYRGIMLDGVDAHDNRIIGNWIGFTRTGAASQASTRSSSTPAPTTTSSARPPSPIATSSATSTTPSTTTARAPTPTSSRTTSCASGRPAPGHPAPRASTTTSGPRTTSSVATASTSATSSAPRPSRASSTRTAGTRPCAAAVGHNPDLGRSTTTSVIGNWVGFRMDGSYDANYRSGLNFSSADNGQGINIYDGDYDNLVDGNYIAAVYDGVQIMAPNSQRNTVSNNIIGVSPLGQAAPLTGWGVRFKWGTKFDVVVGNTIRNAARGGVGLIETNVYNIQISRRTSSPTRTVRPSTSRRPPAAPPRVPTTCRRLRSSHRRPRTGSGAPVSRARSSRSTGPADPPANRSLPSEFLGDATVASDGTWKLDITGVSAGQRVTALQIRTDDNTSALGNNVDVVQAAAPPQSGDIILSDDFGRTLAGSWGNVDQGGAWALTGTATDFSVSGSAAQITAAAGRITQARVGVASTADVDVTGTLTFDKVPAGTSAYAYVLARASGTNAYRAAVRVSSGGLVYVQLKKAVSNVESNIGSEVAVGLTLTPGSPIGFRFRVVGTNLSLRAWDATGSEPAAWTVTGSDSTAALAGAGSAGLRTYFGTAVSNGPLTVSLDAFRVLVP